MDLSDVNFTEKDVREFMDNLDVDAILYNIDHMSSDDQYKSSFSHNGNFLLNVKKNKNRSGKSEIIFSKVHNSESTQFPYMEDRMELIA